jgi:hypothetical protein
MAVEENYFWSMPTRTIVFMTIFCPFVLRYLPLIPLKTVRQKTSDKYKNKTRSRCDESAEIQCWYTQTTVRELTHQQYLMVPVDKEIRDQQNNKKV